LTRRMTKRSVLNVVNRIVLVLLAWQLLTIVLLQWGFSRIRDSVKQGNLPYPLDLVLEVHRGNLTSSPSKSTPLFPGYAMVKQGTFRDRYPSTTLQGTGTFDEIMVVTSPKCEHQWEEFQKKANLASLSYLKWPQTDQRHMSLRSPPLEVAPEALRDSATGNRAVISILKRQIGYLDAHRRLWDYVVKTGKQRVLVLDDTLFPTDRLLNSFPSLMTNIDQESVARQEPWHFVFLRRRRHAGHGNMEEAVWSMNTVYNHAVVQANMSHGAGAYVLSLHGARWLLEHVKRYRVPLDVEIGLLQREFPTEFVALSACNNDLNTEFCPEVVMDISSQHSKLIFDCVWRRLQERRTAGLFDSHY